MTVFFEVFNPDDEPYTIVTKPAVLWPLTVPNGSPSARSGWPSPLKSYGLATVSAALADRDDPWAAPAAPAAPMAVIADTASARVKARGLNKPLLEPSREKTRGD